MMRRSAAVTDATLRAAAEAVSGQERVGQLTHGGSSRRNYPRTTSRNQRDRIRRRAPRGFRRCDLVMTNVGRETGGYPAYGR